MKGVYHIPPPHRKPDHYCTQGWIPLGLTKGFSRVSRQDCDLYGPNGRPKSVWVKPLAKDAVET